MTGDLLRRKRVKPLPHIAAWVQYHCENAELQILDGEIHRQQHKGMRKPPWGELFLSGGAACP